MPLLPSAPILRQLPKETGSTLYEAVYGSPFGNDMLLDFATETVSQERLGQRGVMPGSAVTGALRVCKSPRWSAYGMDRFTVEPCVLSWSVTVSPVPVTATIVATGSH